MDWLAAALTAAFNPPDKATDRRTPRSNARDAVSLACWWARAQAKGRPWRQCKPTLANNMLICVVLFAQFANKIQEGRRESVLRTNATADSQQHGDQQRGGVLSFLVCSRPASCSHKRQTQARRWGPVSARHKNLSRPLSLCRNEFRLRERIPTMTGDTHKGSDCAGRVALVVLLALALSSQSSLGTPLQLYLVWSVVLRPAFRPSHRSSSNREQAGLERKSPPPRATPHPRSRKTAPASKTLGW